jgi:hypothetical protein
MADNRVGAGVGQRTVRIVPFGGMDELSDTDLQPLYSYEGGQQYCVVHLRFIATSTNVLFRPDTYDATGYIGVHVNAVNILQDVLPQGKMFYVANNGNDNNDGMSRDTPWASLSRVHERTYAPGDCILFRRGDKWNGRLTPSGNGISGQPIILSAYGDGAHPLIDGGDFSSGDERLMGVITLTQASHWIIDGFELTAWGTTQNFRSGIAIKNDGGSTSGGLVIRNNYIHDVMGGYRAADSNIPGRWTAGINVWARDGGLTQGTLIENNVIEDVVGCGVQVWGPDAIGGVVDWSKLAENVTIRGNRVFGCACDNILYIGCRDPLVELNHSGFSGLHGRFPSSIAGLWGTRSDGGVQQYNHSHNSMQWAGDGESFDAQALGIDLWMRGTTTLRYNFTHDNYGGFALNYFNGEDTSGAPPAILLCHHNISINEPRFTSGRDERHYHGLYYSPTDDYQLHWGFNNLTLNSNAFIAGSMGPNANTIPRTLNNLWWKMPSKPTQDTTGVLSDPEFVAAPPDLIYRDEYISYNAGDPNTPVASGQLERRWFGSKKTASYNVFGESSSFWVGRVRALELSSAGAAALALVGNLAESVAGPLTLRMLVRNESSVNSTDWLAFLFSNSAYSAKPFVTDSTVRHGTLIRANGECQAFSNGTETSTPIPWVNQKGANQFHIISFVFTDTAGTGNAFNGNGTRIRMFSDGLLLSTTDVPQMTQLHFSYNVYGSTWWVRQLYVSARNGDWDAYDDYVGMLPSATSPLLNTATPGLVSGAKDFFRGDLDGSPNRGAIERTSMVGYTQTVSFIEVIGRYRLLRSSSGTREFGFRAIARDQNFRVVPGQPEWSLFPVVDGVLINSQGVVSVNSTVAIGTRFAVKASAGGVTKSFPVEIIS